MENLNIPSKTINILLFGETGNGKSALGNYLLGNDAFKGYNDYKGGTKVTVGKRGVGDNSNLFVIDTPGLDDRTGEDKKHMIQLVEYIRQHKELNAILVVFNFQQVRFPYNMQTMLKLFCNIFPMKEVGNHFALIFTNTFTKRGEVTPEQKSSKANKILPEFKRVIEEASGSPLSNGIPLAFVDMDPDEGLDENGKMDLERIISWASSLDNLNTDKIHILKSDVREETQDFNEIKMDGEYIIKTSIKKVRDVYSQIYSTITYGEWKEKERREEKIINTEIEKNKKLNQIIKEQEKKIKELEEENKKLKDMNNK